MGFSLYFEDLHGSVGGAGCEAAAVVIEDRIVLRRGRQLGHPSQELIDLDTEAQFMIWSLERRAEARRAILEEFGIRTIMSS